MLVLGFEWDVTLRMLSLADNLNFNSFRTNVIEYQLDSLTSLCVNPAGNAYSYIWLLLSFGEALILLEVFPKVVCDLEFVRVRIRRFGLSQLVDSRTSNLKVLLYVLMK